jgi:hypothetical protein
MNREEVERYSMSYPELYDMVQTVETKLRDQIGNTVDWHDIANNIACYCRNYTEELMLARVKGTVKEVMERIT